MALQALLDKIDDLPEALRAEYKQGSDGKYRLDVAGIEDVGALLSAKNHEKEARRNAEREAAKVPQLQEEIEKLTGERDGLLSGAIPKADVDRLEASWKEKLEKAEKVSAEKISALEGSLSQVMVDGVANTMAAELSSTSHMLLAPHIKQRLKMEMENGKPVTRVLDQDGKPSALSLDDLRQEILDNPAYAPILDGSKASGGGAAGNQSGKGGVTDADFFNKKSPHYSITGQSKIYSENPQRYNELKEASSV